VVVVVVVVVDDGRENSSIPESTESSSAVTSRRFRDLARFDRSAGACPCGVGCAQVEALTVQQSPGASTSGAADGQGRRLGFGAIVSLIGVGVLLIFMIQNTEDVTLDFLAWSFTWPLWLFTIVMALIGALVWFGLGLMRRHRRRKTRREDRRY